MLEERLIEHDESRKAVQSKLKKRCSGMRKDAALLEEKISTNISEDFKEREEEILGLIAKLNEEEHISEHLAEKIGKSLSIEWKYEIEHLEKNRSFASSYKLKVSSAEAKKKLDFDDAESIINQLQGHANNLNESKDAARDMLAEICNGRRKEAGALERRINGKLEEAFKQEDARVQEVVKLVRENVDCRNPAKVKELVRKAQLTLLVNQKYSLCEEDSLGNYDLRVKREASLEFIDFEEKKPMDFTASATKKEEITLSFSFFDGDEAEVLKEVDIPSAIEVEIWEKEKENGTSNTLTKEFALKSQSTVLVGGSFVTSTTYCLKMRIVHQGMKTQWSDEAEFILEFKDCCAWKECPKYVNREQKYSIYAKNPRIAMMSGSVDWLGALFCCAIIGDMPVPLNKVTSWRIKLLRSRNNNGSVTCVGVAPSDINQNDCGDVNNIYGWYFDCFSSTLYSGPPHNHKGKEYGPRKGRGQYVRTGDSVGVVMDTERGELSFALNGVNLGVAFEGIPLDKPLVPCVILRNVGDLIELDTSEVIKKEKVAVEEPRSTPKNLRILISVLVAIFGVFAYLIIRTYLNHKRE